MPQEGKWPAVCTPGMERCGRQLSSCIWHSSSQHSLWFIIWAGRRGKREGSVLPFASNSSHSLGQEIGILSVTEYTSLYYMSWEGNIYTHNGWACSSTGTSLRKCQVKTLYVLWLLYTPIGGWWQCFISPMTSISGESEFNTWPKFLDIYLTLVRVTCLLGEGCWKSQCYNCMYWRSFL